MQDDYLKSFFKSLNSVSAVAAEQKRLQQQVTDAIGGYAIDPNLYASTNLVLKLSPPMSKDFLKSLGLQQSIEGFMESIIPTVPNDLIELINLDVNTNASTLTALAKSAQGAPANLFIADQVARISISYNSFINGLIGVSSNAKALVLGHRLASEAIQFSGNAFTELINFPRIGVDFAELEVVSPSIFSLISRDVQEIDVDNAAPIAEQYVLTVRSTDSGRIVTLAGEMITLLHEINRISEVSFGEPTFKATNKTEYALGMLPLEVITSDDSYFAFVERLFFLIYESSAEFDRLKLIDPEFPKVLDRIKHARLYKAHDTQHGSPRDIERKGRQIGDIFEDLIGKRYPEDETDWTQAQIKLMEELVAYHVSIKEKLLYGESQED
ncbi:hypothetical protein BH24BAC1_BH24BAC1_26100 [soil metagenome]